MLNERQVDHIIRTFLHWMAEHYLPERMDPVIFEKVSKLGLSLRSRNCLAQDNIVYIGDLIRDRTP